MIVPSNFGWSRKSKSMSFRTPDSELRLQMTRTATNRMGGVILTFVTKRNQVDESPLELTEHLRLLIESAAWGTGPRPKLRRGAACH